MPVGAQSAGITANGGVELVNGGAWFEGWVKIFNEDKKFGFIQTQDPWYAQNFGSGKDIFLRRQNMEYKVSEAVKFQITVVNGQPQAVNLTEGTGSTRNTFLVGMLKSFNDQNGKDYGFIQCNDTFQQYG